MSTPTHSPPMSADELRQWFRYIEYQNRLIIWAVSGAKPDQRPYPPAGVIETQHPDGTTETRIADDRDV